MARLYPAILNIIFIHNCPQIKDSYPQFLGIIGLSGHMKPQFLLFFQQYVLLNGDQ